jgi:hypothetical protein
VRDNLNFFRKKTFFFFSSFRTAFSVSAH